MHTSTDVPIRRRPPSASTISKSSGGTRHLRASNLPACSAPARSRSTEIEALSEDTLELFLTPEQIYQLEESARLAVGREPRQRSPQPPRLKVINTPRSKKVHALPPVAPPVGMPRALSEEEGRDAPPLTKAENAPRREEPSTATDAPDARSRVPSPSESQSPSALPTSSGFPAASAPQAVEERPHRRATTSIFRRRSVFQLVIALLVPAIAVAAMMNVSAFHLPIAPLPASAIERPPLSAAPVAQTSTPTTAVAKPAIAELPVKFANPFDRSEIFEFPPGTTRQDARDAVAQILIDRASERRNRVRTVRR